MPPHRLQARLSRFGSEQQYLLLAAISGFLIVLSEPPFPFFPLAYVALVPLLATIRKDKPRQSFFCGFFTGIVSFTGLLYWVVLAMNRYGAMSLPLSLLVLILLVLYLSLFPGLFSLTVALTEKRFGLPRYLSAPLLWALFEYVRGFLLTGFPWSLLAHSQYSFLPIVQIVSVTGTYFLSLVIVAVNCIVYGYWRKVRLPKSYVGAVTLIVALSIGYGMYVLQAPVPPKNLNGLIVQGNFTQDQKWDPKKLETTVETYVTSTVNHGKGTDLVIWPETALPFSLDDATEAREGLVSLARTINSTILVGTISRNREGKVFNSAYLFDPQGTAGKIYHKVHLVPFGEFTPLRDYFPFLDKISVAHGEFFPGTSHKPLKSPFGDIGVLICYEGAFPSITNETVNQGAGVLVNMTNDAWFGHSSAPYQHLAFYVFRAVETGRYVLRSANTGISAIIDPAGRIESQTDLFTRTVLKGGFSSSRGVTFYTRYGDYVILLAAVILILLIAALGASGLSRRG